MALLGDSSTTHSFRVKADTTAGFANLSWINIGTPLGRFEWEVKPLGVPFDGTGLGSLPSVPLTGAPHSFDALVSYPSTQPVRPG